LHASNLSKYRANDEEWLLKRAKLQFYRLWLCADTVTGGDPTTCGGLHGRWRVKVSASLNSEPLHAVPQRAGL